MSGHCFSAVWLQLNVSKGVVRNGKWPSNDCWTHSKRTNCHKMIVLVYRLIPIEPINASHANDCVYLAQAKLPDQRKNDISCSKSWVFACRCVCVLFFFFAFPIDYKAYDFIGSFGWVKMRFRPFAHHAKNFNALLFRFKFQLNQHLTHRDDAKITF